VGSVLPLRPRFLHELVVVPFEQELIVEGTDQFHALQGVAVQTILPHLISLMDGERTLDQLKTALPGIPEAAVLAVVSLLCRWGLVEDGGTNSTPELHSNIETLRFLRRYVGVTGCNQSGGQAYERLRNSEVLVLNSAGALQATECLKALLEKVGVGRLTPLDRDSLHEWRRCTLAVGMQSLAVSLSFNGEDCEWHQKLDDWCRVHHMPWLRVVLSETATCADLGPLFYAKRTPCYRCFNAVHFGLPSSRSPVDKNRPGIDAYFWTSMAAIEVIYFLSRIGTSSAERYCERYDLTQWTSKRLPWPRVPGCLHCRPLTQELSGLPSQAAPSVDTAIVFEDYIASSSRSLASRPIREDTSTISLLSKQAKRMPNCVQYPLNRRLSKLERPALEVLRQGTDRSRPLIAVDDLATILMLTAGIRDLGSENKKVQRWTASAGNLGSVELFVVVHKVEGLAPGVYFYQSREHSLALFSRRDGMLGIADFMRRVVGSDTPDLPDVIVLLTGAFHRLQRKYGAFAYKLVNLDAGVAVSQLHLAARTLHLSSWTAVRWADDLVEQQLNLDAQEEHCTALVALHARPRTPAASTIDSLDHSTLRYGHPPSAKRPRDFCDLPLRQVGDLLYRESRLSEHELRLGAFECPSGLLSMPDGQSSSLTLPLPPNGGGRLVGDILAQRTTVRHFATDPISANQLGVMLNCAHDGDREQWREEHRIGQPLTFYVLAWRLAQFDPGVYIYDGEKHALRFAAPVRSSQESARLFLQAEFSSASVVVWIAGNLAASCARLGALGHRHLLLRAGSAGHRLWMAALAMGLSGGITAGVVPEAAREQFGLDGYQQVSLLAFATGVEAQFSRESQDTALEEEPE
jgi:SagB-type dehydrogenase family enzyme